MSWVRRWRTELLVVSSVFVLTGSVFLAIDYKQTHDEQRNCENIREAATIAYYYTMPYGYSSITIQDLRRYSSKPINIDGYEIRDGQLSGPGCEKRTI